MGKGRRAGEAPHEVFSSDLVATAGRDPAQGGEARLDGEPGLRGGEVASGPGQRARVARCSLGEGDRLVVEPGILRRGEPLAFLTRRAGDQIIEDLRGRLGWLLLRDRAEGREERRPLV